MKTKFLFCVFVFASFTLLQLSSCAALMRWRCNREYAAKKGMEDAEAGRLAMPSRLEGNSCDGGEYSPSDFTKDYAFGFQQKKQEICQAHSAAALGKTDGEQGLSQRPQKAKLGVCADARDAAKLTHLYEAEFRKAFCAPARATKVGGSQAQAWQAEDFDSVFADCKNSKSLKKAHTEAYREVMGAACTASGAEKLGADEAQARRPLEQAQQKLALCQSVGKSEAVLAALERSYKATRSRLDQEDAQRVAAEQERARQAKVDEFQKKVATTQFPFQLRNYLSRCSVAGDRSFVQVEVENQYPDQVLIQGNWKVSYFNEEFNKITEDRTAEAVLVTGNNKKTFQKLTLPKNATFCRAEYLGQGT